MSDKINQQAVNDANEMNDLSRTGERVAELMLEDIYAGLKNEGAKPQQLEAGVNKYINMVNAEANKNTGYNLSFEIVDTNGDGKWNDGEKVQVHNESRWGFRQPKAFDLDGAPDQRGNGADAILTEAAQVKLQNDRQNKGQY